jgi:hypothetical protein
MCTAPVSIVMPLYLRPWPPRDEPRELNQKWAVQGLLYRLPDSLSCSHLGQSCSSHKIERSRCELQQGRK